MFFRKHFITPNSYYRSAVRAQTGSWSWKPYTYESKQVCDSELRFIRPGYARDSTGKWQVVVQTEDLPQRVAIDLCHSPGKPCKSFMEHVSIYSSGLNRHVHMPIYFSEKY